MSVKRALITGITGQDGAYLSKLLLESAIQLQVLFADHPTPVSTIIAFVGLESAIRLSSAMGI
jgi:GDP-D-mannose dehydratase